MLWRVRSLVLLLGTSSEDVSQAPIGLRKADGFMLRCSRPLGLAGPCHHHSTLTVFLAPWHAHAGTRLRIF